VVSEDVVRYDGEDVNIPLFQLFEIILLTEGNSLEETIVRNTEVNEEGC